jgi:hypothetical protein
VLYDADGLVVLDLATPLRDASRRDAETPLRPEDRAKPEAPDKRSEGSAEKDERGGRMKYGLLAGGNEASRRDAWVRELADREGLHDAWSLSTRADLRFEDGTGGLRYVDDSIDDPRWYEVTHPASEPAKRGTAILPLMRRVHLRVRGTSDMRLALRAAIALNTVYTHPRLDISLDGELLTSAVADAAGHYAVEVTVSQGRLAGGWHDLYLVFSSIVEPDKDVHDLRIARLESVEWAPP